MALTLVVIILSTLVCLLWIYFRRPRQLDYSPYSPSKFLFIDGLKIHYVQEGSGPDVILIHGIGSSLQFWRDVFHRLSERNRVTAIDLPGHGLSDKNPDLDYGLDEQTERVLAIIDGLDIQKPTLVGHSMGGGLAAWASKCSPQKVEKLALLAPALTPNLVKINPRMFGPVVQALKSFIVTPSLVRWIYKGICVDTKFLASSPPEKIKNIILQYYLPFHQSPAAVTVFYKQHLLLQDKRLSQNLKLPAHIPLLLIHGEKDKLVPPASLLPFLNGNPHGQYVQVPRCGHMLTEENPEFVTEILKKFFDTPTN